ncbi:predicted protein [Nematostella vectensis]|uniref:lysoplasmalogenase n=2 Tax=Nematostella vectensis TaxID=45351 RepID=A7RIH1_NEMVE|nr:predicted protein [Nematostella vectensis]|eukprot:XP_001640871.1 predicted protein [Nematostella vectensis]
MAACNGASNLASKSYDYFSLLQYRLAPADVLKTAGPKLVPFFKTVCVYFVAWLPESDRPTIFAALLKILPIACLCGFVTLQGVSLTKQHDYSRRILLGLIFSMIGDVCLVWKHSYFIHGMVAFAIAHLLYMRSFGFRPLKPLTGIICLLLMLPFYVFYFPNLKGLLFYAVPVYIVVIGIMVWRAITGLQAQIYSDDGLWRWTKLCACLGALSFAISDAAIGLNKFCFPIPHSRAIIMFTYYGGQLGIALSTFSLDDEYHLRMKQTLKSQ